MNNGGLKHFARVGERLVDTALADRADRNEVLLGVEKDDTQGFAIQKAHFGTVVCNCLGTINPSRTTAIVIGTGETVSRGASLSQPSIKS